MLSEQHVTEICSFSKESTDSGSSDGVMSRKALQKAHFITFGEGQRYVENVFIKLWEKIPRRSSDEF